MFSSGDDSGLDQAEHEEQEPLLYETRHVTNQEAPPSSQGLTRLGVYIAQALGEAHVDIVVKATNILGREKALYFLEYALRSQKQNAGYVIKSGQRVRTPGGMFLRLIKDDPNTELAMLKEIFRKPSKDIRIKHQKAKSARSTWHKHQQHRAYDSKTRANSDGALRQEMLTIDDEFDTFSASHYSCTELFDADDEISDSEGWEPHIIGEEDGSHEPSISRRPPLPPSQSEPEQELAITGHLSSMELFSDLPSWKIPFFLRKKP